MGAGDDPRSSVISTDLDVPRQSPEPLPMSLSTTNWPKRLLLLILHDCQCPISALRIASVKEHIRGGLIDAWNQLYR
jgi:hypothetical protein